jgi:Legionella pneumophila major outer membrane protein precursor
MHRKLLVCSTLLTSIIGHCDPHSRVSRLETDMQKIGAENAYGHFGSRTASAQPQIDGYGIFVTADFLWWKLYEGGTDYLFKDQNARGVPPAIGEIKHCNFDWEPGFKIGAGYLFDYDSWDTAIDFTYYQTNARHSSKSSHLFPLIGDQSLDLIEAKIHWDVSFYDLHWVLGRNYFVSKFLSFRPFFGIATAWIDQHRHLHLRQNGNDRIALKSENDFWGIGPRVGVDTQFALCENFSIYGNVTGDLLWADFEVSEKEVNKTTSTEIYDLDYDLDSIVPTLSFGLGVAYETNLSKDRYHIMIKAGYENQYWWRQNQLPVFEGSIPAFHRISEDLSLQGLTVEFRLDF